MNGNSFFPSFSQTGIHATVRLAKHPQSPPQSVLQTLQSNASSLKFQNHFYSLRSSNSCFYVYGFVHRWSILIIVQRDATQSSLFIILRVHSICFGCQPHPSSGVHKTVTTASGTVQLPPSNVAKDHFGGR